MFFVRVHFDEDAVFFSAAFIVKIGLVKLSTYFTGIFKEFGIC